MRACATALFEGKESKSVLRGHLQKCSKAHTEMTKLAAQGKGWDRHLFALKLLAIESGTDRLPPIFEDQAFQFCNEIILSTSTLSSTNFGVGGFCPVSPKGYGLGYQIRDQDLGAVISVYKNHSISSTDMVQALEKSFQSISSAIQD